MGLPVGDNGGRRTPGGGGIGFPVEDNGGVGRRLAADAGPLAVVPADGRCWPAPGDAGNRGWAGLVGRWPETGARPGASDGVAGGRGALGAGAAAAAAGCTLGTDCGGAWLGWGWGRTTGAGAGGDATAGRGAGGGATGRGEPPRAGAAAGSARCGEAGGLAPSGPEGA